MCIRDRILYFEVVFEKIAEKFAPFFETHLHEDSVFELFIQMAYTRSSCLIAAESLLFRIETALGNDHKQQLKDCLKQCKEIAFYSSKDALTKTLQMVNVYTLWKSIIPVLVMFLIVLQFDRRPEEQSSIPSVPAMQRNLSLIHI